MQAGLTNVFDGINAFSETEQKDDLKKVDMPTLIIHGDDDQTMPMGTAALPGESRRGVARGRSALFLRRLRDENDHRMGFHSVNPQDRHARSAVLFDDILGGGL
jgi:hypothetical protein